MAGARPLLTTANADAEECGCALKTVQTVQTACLPNAHSICTSCSGQGSTEGIEEA